MLDRHQKGDFTLAGTTFTFKRSFHKKVKDSCDSAKTQVCSLHLLKKRGLTKVFE